MGHPLLINQGFINPGLTLGESNKGWPNKVLVSYGFLTTLCSSGLPPYLPARYGYAAAYSIACLAMLVALVVFLGYSNCYRPEA